MSETYTVKYFQDEIRLFETDGICMSPVSCECNTKPPKCFYTADEAKELLVNYYAKKAEYIRRQTTQEFLNDQGFYS